MRLTVVLLAVAAAWGQPHENLNAVVWMQTAAEYQASALQTYRAAEASLLRALKDPNWTATLEQTGDFRALPPAVILDLDETVLDNSVYQARLAADNKTFTDESWAAWVAERKAGLVPGARDFLNFAHAHGVRLFYVTNRVCSGEDPADPTAAMLRSLHLPQGVLLCKAKAGDSSDKSPRRGRAASTHRILLLIGDDFNDFVTMPREQATVAGRADAVRAYARFWGERWFVLPNPTYGSWERAVGYTAAEKRKALRR